MSRNHAYPTKKMLAIVVVHMSTNRNTCQSIVCVDFVCLCIAQQVKIKGVCTSRTLSVCSLLQTWLKKNWQISSLVTTVARATLALLVTMHLALCFQMPNMMDGMDQKDGKNLALQGCPVLPKSAWHMSDQTHHCVSPSVVTHTYTHKHTQTHTQTHSLTTSDAGLSPNGVASFFCLLQHLLRNQRSQD